MPRPQEEGKIQSGGVGERRQMRNNEGIEVKGNCISRDQEIYVYEWC